MVEIRKDSKNDSEPEVVTAVLGPRPLAQTLTTDDFDQLWCKNASLLTETAWEYVIVHQEEFEKLRLDEFSDLVAPGPVQDT